MENAIADLLELEMCGMSMKNVSEDAIRASTFKNFCPSIKNMLIYYRDELASASMLSIIRLIIYLISLGLLDKPGKMECVQLSRFLIDMFEPTADPFVDDCSLFLAM